MNPREGAEGATTILQGKEEKGDYGHRDNRLQWAPPSPPLFSDRQCLSMVPGFSPLLPPIPLSAVAVVAVSFPASEGRIEEGEKKSSVRRRRRREKRKKKIGGCFGVRYPPPSPPFFLVC